jgi:hypothetical protein
MFKKIIRRRILTQISKQNFHSSRNQNLQINQTFKSIQNPNKPLKNTLFNKKLSQSFLRNNIERRFSSTVEANPLSEDSLSTWIEEIKSLHWEKLPTHFMQLNETSATDYVDLPQWFPGGELNLAHNCLVHNKDDNALAVSYSNLMGDGHGQLTYKQLRKKVNKTAAVMKSLGLKKDDIVIIMMSNSVEMVISMLACMQLGVVFKNLPPGLGPKALGEVLSLIDPKLLIIASSESKWFC